jgi:hypothetical protein
VLQGGAPREDHLEVAVRVDAVAALDEPGGTVSGLGHDAAVPPTDAVEPVQHQGAGFRDDDLKVLIVVRLYHGRRASRVEGYL